MSERVYSDILQRGISSFSFFSLFFFLSQYVNNYYLLDSFVMSVIFSLFCELTNPNCCRCEGLRIPLPQGDTGKTHKNTSAAVKKSMQASCEPRGEEIRRKIIKIRSSVSLNLANIISHILQSPLSITRSTKK